MPRNDAVVARYKRQIARYRDATSLALVAAWGKLPSYDEADVEEFEALAAPSLGAGQAASVALSAAFFALVLDLPPVGVDPSEVGITPDTRGPFRATWHALAMGRPFEEAVTVGRSTAQAVGFDFVQSSARRTGDAVAARSGVGVRWQRVPGAKSCDWCRRVAGNHYRTAESADFGHERDDCDVVPVLL